MSVTLPIFSLPCKTNKDCDIVGQLCCNVNGKMRCQKGVPKPAPKPIHTPLLGFIPRECPTNPVIEILPVKNCTNDTDCWPRICCPDGQHSYCRSTVPEWERDPSGFYPLRSMIPYLQCTPPPPLLFDLFPKPCRTPIDCFPNLCCQEQGKKFCRPPKKSLLALIATVTQRLGRR
ncbi:uncharacterized protein LOC111870129 [Cryptotermes secundus]|uniref:uncharacterized protein LOC111870129 n=1 Tax=Cryptotermes secundus TaxID=105785 RepID=UPI000CD7D76A|nr:uncharacterized protein LOC111870129 [Cryptotermes secundus]